MTIEEDVWGSDPPDYRAGKPVNGPWHVTDWANGPVHAIARCFPGPFGKLRARAYAAWLRLDYCLFVERP